MVKLWFAKVRPDGIIPSKRDEDAGYDIFLAFDDLQRKHPLDQHSKQDAEHDNKDKHS